MIKLKRTNSGNRDFRELIKELDAYLAEKDGEAHSFYAPFNTVDAIQHVVVAYENDIPLGCGAIKKYDSNTMEIKRMYTAPESRGKGIASRILIELEIWAGELSCQKCLLETGRRQSEAIGLYHKNGYQVIPNYGQYIGIDDSICFQKEIEQK